MVLGCLSARRADIAILAAYAKTIYMRQLYLPILLLLLLGSCANIQRPSGGERDVTPPAVDSSRSTANLQTNFQKQDIDLTFDEWVVLEDVFNQVIVSPPLEYQPEITLRGRTVTFAFDDRERLRENATYTINFGEAVKDLTEKNPAEDLRYVFSTGPQLDSLRLRGRIVDARSGEAQEGFLFMLYDNTADSVVRTQRPFYFGRSDAQGAFSIQNIRPGTYKAFALKDGNLNYLYDQQSERIGFPGELLGIGPDSSLQLTIRSFQEAPAWRLINNEIDRYGLVNAILSRSDGTVQVTASSDIPQLQSAYREDTLKIWYHPAPKAAWSLYLKKDSVLQDTINVRAYESVPELRVRPQRKQLASHNPTKPLRLSFQDPLSSADSSLIQLQLDSSIQQSIRVTIDSTDRRQLTLRSNWVADSSYQLLLLPGALTNLYGGKNDSISYRFTTQAQDQLGTILFTLTELDSTQRYFLQFLQGGETEVASYRISDLDQFTTTLRSIQPGNYSIALTVDRNDNGRWDTGDYRQRRQAERYYTRQLEALRPNWDLEVTVRFSELIR